MAYLHHVYEVRFKINVLKPAAGGQTICNRTFLSISFLPVKTVCKLKMAIPSKNRHHFFLG